MPRKSRKGIATTGDVGTTNIQLDTWGQILCIPGFHGVRTRPTKTTIIKNGCVIYNEGKSTHWTCMLFEDGKPMWFDSYGFPPRQCVIDKYPKIVISTEQFQSLGNPNCGQYSLLFLYIATLYDYDTALKLYRKHKSEGSRWIVKTLNKLLSEHLRQNGHLPLEGLEFGEGFLSNLRDRASNLITRAKDTVGKAINKVSKSEAIQKVANITDKFLNSEIGVGLKNAGVAEIASRLNQWRRANTKPGENVRELYPGELHYKKSNFMGPGTKMNLPNVANYEPVNKADAIAKIHDIDFENIANKRYSSEQEKFNDVQSADAKFLQSMRPLLTDSDPEVREYAQAGFTGIMAKYLAEKSLGRLIYKF